MNTEGRELTTKEALLKIVTNVEDEMRRIKDELKRPSEPVGLSDKFCKAWKLDTDGMGVEDSCDHLVNITKSHYFGPEQEKALADHLRDQWYLDDWGPKDISKRVCEWFRAVK